MKLFMSSLFQTIILNGMWTYFGLFFKSIIKVHKVQVVGCRSVRCVVKCAVHVTRVNR